jgi:hypothetical protein
MDGSYPLWDFGTSASSFSCAHKGIKARALYLDLTDVDPSRSDIMAGIFSPPRCTPSDVWMLIERSRSLPASDLMTAISPPPELLHSPEIGKICKCSKVSASEPSTASPNAWVLTFSSPPELWNLEQVCLLCTPCT